MESLMEAKNCGYLAHWLQRDRSLGSLLFLPSDVVGEQDCFLRHVQSGKRREALDVLHLGISALHVRLPREDADAKGVRVGIGTAGRDRSQKQGGDECDEVFHAV
jgi:hypothetical protein